MLRRLRGSCREATEGASCALGVGGLTPSGSSRFRGSSPPPPLAGEEFHGIARPIAIGMVMKETIVVAVMMAAMSWASPPISRASV